MNSRIGALLITLLGVALVAAVLLVPRGETARPEPTPASSPTQTQGPVTSPPATGTPSAAATATASPTAAAGQILDRRYGLVVRRPAVEVRSEADPATITTLQPADASGGRPDPLGFARSPGSTAVAFWSLTGSTTTLHIYDAIRRATSVAYAPPTEERGTGVVWHSPDRLLITTSSVARRQGIDAPPEYAVMRSLDLRTRAEKELLRVREIDLSPVAWDEQRKLAAAVEIGAGGFARAYLIVREDGTVTRTVLQNTLSVVGSATGHVVANADVQTQGVVRTWPIDAPAQVKELRPAAGQTLSHAGFRPRHLEVVVRTLPTPVRAPAQATAELWDILSGSRRPLSLDGASFVAFRPDGEGYYVALPGESARYRLRLIDGRSSDLPAEPDEGLFLPLLLQDLGPG